MMSIKKKKKKKKTVATRVKKATKIKPLYALKLITKDKVLLDVIHHSNYDMLMMEGMELSHEEKCYWEIYDIYGRYIDGSFRK